MPLGLFEGFGVELEYMIVDAESLEVRPIADTVLRGLSGNDEGDFDRGAFTWSNELTLHVLEVKTTDPVPTLHGLAEGFQAEVHWMNGILKSHGCRLLPGAMHPWMDPHRETRLWPHTYQEIYAAFNRIFDCRGHGWGNLQSTHLNLPFRNDQEFRVLHSAIRLLLPLLPSLTAGSPVADGAVTGLMDTRLKVYAENCARIPSVTNGVVPEVIRSRAEYESSILQRIYRDMEPFDPEGILRHEWCNARGAIARFDRNAIEIRVLDVQECPAADLAILECVVASLKNLITRPLDLLEAPRDDLLRALLQETIANADQTEVDDPEILAALDLLEAKPASTIWDSLPGANSTPTALSPETWSRLRRQGPLARRLLQSLPPNPNRQDLRRLWGRLAHHLEAGTPLVD